MVKKRCPLWAPRSPVKRWFVALSYSNQLCSERATTFRLSRREMRSSARPTSFALVNKKQVALGSTLSLHEARASALSVCVMTAAPGSLGSKMCVRFMEQALSVLSCTSPVNPSHPHSDTPLSPNNRHHWLHKSPLTLTY